MYKIDYILAISFIIGTALQVIMFIASIVLKQYANNTFDKAKKMTEDAEAIACDAEQIHKGSLMCIEMANELFSCHSNDERANIVIKWVPILQEAGINVNDIADILNR